MITHMTRSHPASEKSQPAADETADSERLRELQERVERYELIFQVTNDVVYEINLDTGHVDWSDALYTRYGYNRADKTNTLEWWTRHVHPDDALLLENKVNDLFRSEDNSWLYDYRFARADGQYNYVHDRGLLLRDEDGTPKKIVGSLLDVTAQKQLDIAKDEFISLVSHQLRTPLTVIRVYGEMLTNGMFGKMNSEQAKWVRNMTESSAHLIDIVGDILNVSRLELGRINLSVRPVDMSMLVETGVRGVEVLAKERGATLTYDAPTGLPKVLLDDAVFAQILHNLLTNAIRYTPSGKGRIKVQLVADDEGYVLSVQDNGIGIPKSAQSHVFERFYRAKNAVDVEVQGSGLGLYLTKVMVDACGGSIWFESAPSKGTTFYVRIPKTGMALQG
jgi:two-component system CheB/CheR fusion protein